MNEFFIIKGGRPLEGKIEVRGSKNAASKMMIATLLTDEPCTIENVPFSAETDITRELCEIIGSKVILDPANHILTLETPDVKTSLVPQLSKKNRIPVLALGPLLHRRGVAEVPVLGGCPIGHRPINFHLEALAKMGVKIERREHSYFAQGDKITGGEIKFPWSSVGATENVLLAAVLADGKTTIANAAVEPEVLNLVDMLQKMGARITVDEKQRFIEIQGVSKLNGVSVRVIPDRNEVVSFAVAGLATGGSVLVSGAIEKHIDKFIEKVKETGGKVITSDQGIGFIAPSSYQNVFVETSAHPGFMTDWQQPFSVLLTQAQGESIIHETIYEDRFGYVKDLGRMGASISISTDCPEERKCRYYGEQSSHVAFIQGPARLQGSEMRVTDLRAGMAHLIAAFTAKGQSIISGIEHIDRGYEKIDERLRQLGAHIERIQDPQIANRQ